MTWTNWSGGQSSSARVIEARDPDQIAQVIAQAVDLDQKLRIAGAGHSFSALVTNDDTVLNLDPLSGIADISDSGVATIAAGTRIYDLGEPLAGAGWALGNQGDIDHQSLAGAISTGTHGTGPTLQNFSAAVVGMSLVSADGSFIECDSETRPDLFEAARCGLGLLGVVSEIKVQLVRAYRLHERVWRESPDECMSRIHERIAATRHFEFFWMPSRDQCELKALDLTESEPDEMTSEKYEYVDHSYKVFPSERGEKFEEMEFSLPAEAGPECFAELAKWIGRRYPDLEWPVEYRTLSSDDLWLSPATGRATVTISVHQAAELPFVDLFNDAQAIFKGFDGRPHWGKRNTMTAAELAPHYPRWEEFCELRRGLDPSGVFLNDWAENIFG